MTISHSNVELTISDITGLAPIIDAHDRTGFEGSATDFKAGVYTNFAPVDLKFSEGSKDDDEIVCCECIVDTTASTTIDVTSNNFGYDGSTSVADDDTIDIRSMCHAYTLATGDLPTYEAITKTFTDTSIGIFQDDMNANTETALNTLLRSLNGLKIWIKIVVDADEGTQVLEFYQEQDCGNIITSTSHNKWKLMGHIINEANFGEIEAGVPRTLSTAIQTAMNDADTSPTTYSNVMENDSTSVHVKPTVVDALSPVSNFGVFINWKV